MRSICWPRFPESERGSRTPSRLKRGAGFSSALATTSTTGRVGSPLKSSPSGVPIMNTAQACSRSALPNPLERTRHGRPLQAFTLFWALRGLPQRASQLKR